MTMRVDLAVKRWLLTNPGLIARQNREDLCKDIAEQVFNSVYEPVEVEAALNRCGYRPQYRETFDTDKQGNQLRKPGWAYYLPEEQAQ